MNCPAPSNSSSCAAAAPKAGPLVLPRDNTKIWLLEFRETPDTSPKYMLDGSRSGSGTESKAIDGTACCASAGGGSNSNNPTSQCRMTASPDLLCLQCMLADGRSLRPWLHAHSPVIGLVVRRMARDTVLQL